MVALQNSEFVQCTGNLCIPNVNVNLKKTTTQESKCRDRDRERKGDRRKKEKKRRYILTPVEPKQRAKYLFMQIVLTTIFQNEANLWA